MAVIEVSYDDGEKYYQLDPCPFCGADRGELTDRYQSEYITECWIECAECTARGPHEILIQEAVDGWNKRAI